MREQLVGIGERVAQRRKLHGLTQAQLAHRAHLSLSLLRKVEQGSTPASPAFTAAVATAIAVARNANYSLPPRTMRSRIAHHNIDLSRAWLLHGDHTKTLHALTIARRTAPQQTRYHPMVAETVLSLARAERRRSESLSSFAAWMGITSW